MRDTTAATLLLTNQITKVGAQPFAPGEFWKLVRRIDDLGTLFEMSATDIERTYALVPAEADRIMKLLDATAAFAVIRAELASQGITLLTAFEEQYPQRLRRRLGNSAPPMLYVAGPIDWLGRKGLGVVGSRDVTANGGKVARAMGRGAAAAGLTTISGAARGVDQLAMNAAHEMEAPVIGITAEGIRRVGRTAEMRRLLADQRICLISPYAPDMAFTAPNAMARNKIIYALSDATVVVASAEGSGGTWNGAVEAIRKTYCPVLVWQGDGEGPGNKALIHRGGYPINDIESAIAAVNDGVLAEPEPLLSDVDDEASQMRLF